KMPGVRLVLTAADMPGLGDLPCLPPPPGVELAVPPYPVLARDTVRHVGDAVAFVVADTLDQARDAAEAIAIDWEALPPAVDAALAVEPGAPQVWESHPENVAFVADIGDREATEAAFAKAARVVTLRLVNPRVVA